jgi:hypothetical protein
MLTICWVLLSDTAKTKGMAFLQMDESNFLGVAVNLLDSENIWAKATGLVAVTGLLPNLLLHQLIFKEVKDERTILYRDHVQSLTQPLNRLVTLVDAQMVMATIVQLRENKEVKSLTQSKTGNEFNVYVAQQVKEYLTVLEVGSLESLIEQYQSFFPSALNSEKEEINVKDTPALIHTFASTRIEFEQLMVQLETEIQHETLIKILELAKVALAKESNPAQFELGSDKDTEIAQLKEILITKDKDLKRLSKAIAAHDAELSQLQIQLTATETTKAE